MDGKVGGIWRDPSGALDALGDSTQLVLAARDSKDHGASRRQRDGDGLPDPSAGSRHDAPALLQLAGAPLARRWGQPGKDSSNRRSGFDHANAT